MNFADFINELVLNNSGYINTANAKIVLRVVDTLLTTAQDMQLRMRVRWAKLEALVQRYNGVTLPLAEEEDIAKQIKELAEEFNRS